MKGKLEKIGDKWFIRYTRYEGGGSFRLPLHPNFVEMTEFVYIKNKRFYDGDEIEFIDVLVNPMGRDVDPNNLGQNHSLCKWYARPYLDEKDEQKQHLIDVMKSDEELGLYDEPEVKEINNYWFCEIGPLHEGESVGDWPLRSIVKDKFEELTGRDALTCSSGWGLPYEIKEINSLIRILHITDPSGEKLRKIKDILYERK
jgi:hypothetical protein